MILHDVMKKMISFHGLCLNLIDNCLDRKIALVVRTFFVTSIIHRLLLFNIILIIRHFSFCSCYCLQPNSFHIK